MKISKNKVTACEAVPVQECLDYEATLAENPVSDIESSKKNAISSLYAALDSLASIADKDDQAKSSISDIAYIILSLQ